jgi:hypothetical protein
LERSTLQRKGNLTLNFPLTGSIMKYTTDRTFADPDKAARRLLEHAQKRPGRPDLH